jgi:uncharacterized membrane protein YfcA
VYNQVLNIVIYSVPGVIIGGQLGPKLQKNVPEDKMKAAIAFVFMILGAFMLYTLV